MAQSERVQLDSGQRREAQEFLGTLERSAKRLATERSIYVDRIKAELTMAADRAREIDRGLFPEEDAVVIDKDHRYGYVQRVPLLLVLGDYDLNCKVLIDFKGILHPNYTQRLAGGKWCYELRYPDQTDDYYYLTYGEKAIEAISDRVKSHLPQGTAA